MRKDCHGKNSHSNGSHETNDSGRSRCPDQPGPPRTYDWRGWLGNDCTQDDRCLTCSNGGRMTELLRIHALVRLARVLVFVGKVADRLSVACRRWRSESWTRQKHGRMRGMRRSWRGRRGESAVQKSPDLEVRLRPGARLDATGIARADARQRPTRMSCPSGRGAS